MMTQIAIDQGSKHRILAAVQQPEGGQGQAEGQAQEDGTGRRMRQDGKLPRPGPMDRDEVILLIVAVVYVREGGIRQRREGCRLGPTRPAIHLAYQWSVVIVVAACSALPNVSCVGGGSGRCCCACIIFSVICFHRWHGGNDTHPKGEIPRSITCRLAVPRPRSIACRRLLKCSAVLIVMAAAQRLIGALRPLRAPFYLTKALKRYQILRRSGSQNSKMRKAGLARPRVGPWRGRRRDEQGDTTRHDPSTLMSITAANERSDRQIFHFSLGRLRNYIFYRRKITISSPLSLRSHLNIASQELDDDGHFQRFCATGEAHSRNFFGSHVGHGRGGESPDTT